MHGLASVATPTWRSSTMGTTGARRKFERHPTMPYGVLFLVLGGSLATLAFLQGGAGWALLWPALSFAAAGGAYLRGRPAMLGKRDGGTFAWWAPVLFGPFLLLTWSIWCIERTVSREDAANEVAPGVWVGRRPLAHEVPANIGAVVDLTAELPAAAGVRRRAGYVCVPVLDGTAPDAETLRSLMDRLRDEKGILLHCASGHGRSATVAAALMMARGLAGDVEEAEAQMRRARPGIRLRAGQRALVRRPTLWRSRRDLAQP
ncbi:MAG: hypothetical protein QM820_59345 [Minicystis sp.]